MADNEHLTEITTRTGGRIVDGVHVPDHKDEEEGNEGGKQTRIKAADAITQAQVATLDELAQLELNETRSTVLAAIAQRRDALANNEGGADHVDAP